MVTIAGDSIIGIVGSIIAIVVFIGNAVYLNGVRQELQSGTSNSNLSRSGAEFFFFMDIILAIVFGIYLIYNIYRIFTTEEQRSFITQKATSFVTGSQAGTVPVTQFVGGMMPSAAGTTEIHGSPEAVVHGQPTVYVDPSTGRRTIAKPTVELHSIPEQSIVSQRSMVSQASPMETRHFVGSTVSNAPPTLVAQSSYM